MIELELTLKLNKEK